MATAPKYVPPVTVTVTVTFPPAGDIDAICGQDIVFKTADNSKFTVCFGLNPKWSAISNKSFPNQTSFTLPTPAFETSISYNFTPLAEQCNPMAATAKTIHVGRN
jgi:hypothetical protein